MKNKKICSFFVSEFHLLTTILPYINEKILENKKIELVLQKDMTIKVKEYLNKVKSLNIKSESILKLDWGKKKIDKILKKDNQIILVIGDKEFIDEIDSIINLDKVEEIIDCYRLDKNEELDKILDKYEKILSTEGIKSLIKNSQNTQERKTIQTQI